MSRKFQEYLHYPGTATLKNYVSNNFLTNCAVTADDVNRAELIYGPPVPYLEGHMVRHKSPIHEKIEKIPLPLMVAKHHLTIALSMDFFFVNKNMFFHTKSQKVDFLTSQYCTSRSLRTIITALQKIINKYNCRGFSITDFHRNNEFDTDALKKFLEPALMHIYGRVEHVDRHLSLTVLAERSMGPPCSTVP